MQEFFTLGEKQHLCGMQKIHFPAYDFRYKSKENQRYVFDIIRKKFVVLTPEEWVRQHALWYLISDKHYPASLVNVEKKLVVGQMTKRYDIAVYDNSGRLSLLVECKRPDVPVTQYTFDQAARYNMVLEAPFLWLTNGLTHYYCHVDTVNKKYDFLKEIPEYIR